MSVITKWINNEKNLDWKVNDLIGTVTFATKRIMDLLDVEKLSAMDGEIADSEEVPSVMKRMRALLIEINQINYISNQKRLIALKSIFQNSIFLEEATVRAFKIEYYDQWIETFRNYIGIIQAAGEHVQGRIAANDHNWVHGQSMHI